MAALFWLNIFNKNVSEDKLNENDIIYLAYKNTFF